MTRRKSSFTNVLFAFANLCNIFLGITDRTWSAQQRAELDRLRAAKVVQDISISKTRQEVLTTNKAIHVRRSAHIIEQDVRKVELADLKIELQRLKVLELAKKLGISEDIINAQNYDDPDEYCKQNGIKRR